MNRKLYSTKTATAVDASTSGGKKTDHHTAIVLQPTNTGLIPDFTVTPLASEVLPPTQPARPFATMRCCLRIR